MKLIDILVKELPARGGWPLNFNLVVQEKSGFIMFGVVPDVIFSGTKGIWIAKNPYKSLSIWGYNFIHPEIKCLELADDYDSSIVTREQYEAAITEPPEVNELKLISTGKHPGSLEQFIRAGWTGSKLIEYGYFRRPKVGEKVESLPGLTHEAVSVKPPTHVNCRAYQFLEKGVQHMKDRAAQRDSEHGERSMKATVDAFNAMFGHSLTETQGWQFMVLLKMARSRNKFNPDDYEDGAAYTGLAGEAHSNEQN